MPETDDENTAPLPRFVRSVASQLSPEQREISARVAAELGLPPAPILRVKAFSERHPLLQELDDVVAAIEELERGEVLMDADRREKLLARHRARLVVLEGAVQQLVADVQPSGSSEIAAEYDRLRAHLGLDGEDLEGLADEGDDDGI